jgi:hypothetical protein
VLPFYASDFRRLRLPGLHDQVGFEPTVLNMPITETDEAPGERLPLWPDRRTPRRYCELEAIAFYIGGLEPPSPHIPVYGPLW